MCRCREGFLDHRVRATEGGERGGGEGVGMEGFLDHRVLQLNEEREKGRGREGTS